MTHRPGGAAAGWSDLDGARLLTCQIVHDIRGGRLPSVRVQTMFRLSPGTVAFVCGPCRVDELRAAGDGSYSRSSGFVFGTGGLGLALLAGSLAANAAGNARRRNRAMADAQVAFRPEFEAHLFVTNDGFVFQSHQGISGFRGVDVDAVQVIDPNVVLVQLRSDRGALTWRLWSPWAELLFVLWALDQHPDHPQMRDGSWLHPAWLDYARSQGHDPRLRSTVLAQDPSTIRLPGQQPQLGG
ncbi:MAG: hypothetical protein ACR2LI_02440 [Propionibacteriaceae bacterium]